MAGNRSVTKLQEIENKPERNPDLLNVELVPGVMLNVLPTRLWRLSAFRALRAGDIDTWAEGCLASAAEVEILFATDPTTEQFEAFAERVNDAAAPGGKSPS